MNPEAVKIHLSRKNALKDQFSVPYFAEIKNFLKAEFDAGYIVYPTGKDIFRAFDLTPFEQVRVVIL